jgi:hypothetical protein
MMGSLLFTVELGLPYLAGGILCLAALSLVFRFLYLDKASQPLAS